MFTELPDRGVLRLSGEDRVQFLQGLVSNDVTAVAAGHAVYACLLTPQGKFLHDFFLVAAGEALLIECEAARRGDLLRRLKMFKLRSKIDLVDVSDEYVTFATLGARPFVPPAGGILYDDSRLEQLGRRILLPKGTADAPLVALGLSWGGVEAYDRLRIALGVPDGSRDMVVEKAILLESNIDLLHGISWDKGCYMGQELTARTRYRGLIKKRLVPVRITGTAPESGEPLIENGREVGEMRSSVGDMRPGPAAAGRDSRVAPDQSGHPRRLTSRARRRILPRS